MQSPTFEVMAGHSNDHEWTGYKYDQSFDEFTAWKARKMSCARGNDPVELKSEIGDRNGCSAENRRSAISGIERDPHGSGDGCIGTQRARPKQHPAEHD